MTLQITTDALVIRERSIGDNDRYVTLMTRDIGIINAYASGAKSIKSRRGSATGLLSYSNFSLSKKGDTYRVNEASAIRVFWSSGIDIETLSLAQYFCELSYIMYPADNMSDEFLRLILNSLHFLIENNYNKAKIKAITELRIAAISGYLPNLVACYGCGKFEDNIMYFKLDDGKLYCKDCKTDAYTVPISLDVLKAMRHIIYADFNKIYSFEINDASSNELSKVTEKYILLQTEHNFKTLDFYNSIVS